MSEATSATDAPAYVDTGWSGTPDAISAAVALYGYQIANGYAALIDPTKQGDVLAIVAGPTLDGVARVLVRSSATLPVPAEITEVGPETTAATIGVMMGDGTERPTTMPYAAFDARWTEAEKDDMAVVAYRLDPARVTSIPLTLSVAIMRGLLLAGGNGDVDIASDNMARWMGAVQMAGIINQARHDTILTP